VPDRKDCLILMRRAFAGWSHDSSEALLESLQSGASGEKNGYPAQKKRQFGARFSLESQVSEQ
jgi:hypothetical protein